MNYIIVTNQWMAERGLFPLPTMRKSKDGMKIILHEDFFNVIGIDHSDLVSYPHNSEQLNTILSGEEWAYSEQDSTASPDYIQAAAIHNLMQLTKTGIQSMSMTSVEALNMADFYPDWSEGVEVKKGERYNCDGSLWEVITAHTTQANWKPSQYTLSLWKKVQAEHAGTLEDPIPYEQGMALEKGKYYTQYDVIYECIMGTETGQPYDLYQLNTLVTPVD